MPDLLDRLGAALLDASLAATAISGLVVLAMVQCRQPARRRGWARAGLIATLALFPLAALNPVPRIDLRGPLRSILPGDLDDPPPGRVAGPRDPSSPPMALLEAEHCSTATPPMTPGPRWPRPAARLAVVAYLGGLSIGLAWMAIGMVGAIGLVGRAAPASTRAQAEYEAMPFEGIAGRPRLRASTRMTRPVLVGWPRSTILIPAGLEAPEAGDRLRLGLLHELAHAEGLDHAFGPASALAQAIWFFVPPVWWIRDQMRLDQEFLADNRAAGHYGASIRYASSLVELAAGGPSKDSRRSPGPIGPAGQGPGVASALFQRVLMLVRCPFAIERRTPIWWRWASAATLTLATLTASCLTLRGMAGWSAGGIASAEEGARPGSFRLAQLAVGQRDNDDQPFDLRFRMPDRFTMTFEVLAEPEDLPAVEVLGHRLGVNDFSADPRAYRLWHRVRIVRSAGSEAVEVDGRNMPAPSGAARLAPWLTIRNLPGQTTRLRDLEIEW